MNLFFRYRNIGTFFCLLFSAFVFGFSNDTIVENNQTLIYISKNTETNLLEKVTIKNIPHKTCIENKINNKPKKHKKVLSRKKVNVHKEKEKQVYKPKVATFSSTLELFSDFNFPDKLKKIVLKENIHKLHKLIERKDFSINHYLSYLEKGLLVIEDFVILYKINAIDNKFTRPPPLFIFLS